MEGRAKLFGHPIHQMLIPFPFGLLATGVVFDIIYLASGNSTMSLVAFYMIAAGIVGGLIAAPFGLVDWLAIPSATRAKAVGAWHGGGNLLVVLLFVGSWYMRYSEPSANHVPSTTALLMSFAGGIIALVTGWLGGELVDRLSVGVDDGAHVDAPSSLTTNSVTRRPRSA